MKLIEDMKAPNSSVLYKNFEFESFCTTDLSWCHSTIEDIPEPFYFKNIVYDIMFNMFVFC